MAHPAEPGSVGHKKLDQLCKQAMSVDEGRLLSLLLTPEVCRRLGLDEGPLVLLDVLPTEFKRGGLDADYLLKVQLGARLLAIHLEFQRRPDPTMPLRIAGYQLSVREQLGLPVLSIVLNVHSAAAEPLRLEALHVGPLSSMQWITVAVAGAVRTWPRHIESPLGVLFRALTGELSDEALLSCFVELRRLGLAELTCRQLIEVLSFLLDLDHGGGGSRHGEMMKRLLMKLKLEDSWIYRVGEQQGIEKAVQSQQDAAIQICQQRFGLDELSARRIRRITSLEQLGQLLVKVATAGNLTDALSALPPLPEE